MPGHTQRARLHRSQFLPRSDASDSQGAFHLVTLCIEYGFKITVSVRQGKPSHARMC